MPSAACTAGASFMIDSLLGWGSGDQCERLQDKTILGENSQSQNKLDDSAEIKPEVAARKHENRLGTPESNMSEERTATPKSSQTHDQNGDLENNQSQKQMGAPESSQAEGKNRTLEKPNQSYIALISRAILSSPEKRLQLSDIYQWIMETYPYYHNQDKSWRNSVRHNLSLNECFIKAGRSDNGKGHYWAVHPANMDDFSRGDYHGRRARRRVRRVSCVLGYPSHFPLCSLRCFHQRFCICCPSQYSTSSLPRLCPLVDNPTQRSRQSLPIPIIWPWHQLPPY